MARTISPTAAHVVEQLELDGDYIVTIQRLEQVMSDIGQSGDARRLAYELQRDGWLGTLRTRHAWEFLPGARGGPISRGDRYVEFRAQHTLDPKWGGVLAFESAASVLGLAERAPDKEVLTLPEGAPFPKALTDGWRHVRVEIAREGIADVDGLPSWGFDGLLAGIAIRPSGYRDLPGLAQWLETSGDKFDEMRVARLLDESSGAVQRRAAYLLRLLGNADGARWMLEELKPAPMTSWFGPHETGGRYDTATMVSDTLLPKFLDVGGGA